MANGINAQGSDGRRWGKAKVGSYCKRLLNKALRRMVKAQLMDLPGKEPTGYRSTVNWRGT